ncbi:hypothetical protein [Haladaptatus caseinilyticus]|uniref:hypothetical protein n=1 Tax=Haladaptatus caseinilyticus TaxID=2993314 RepID=UPI00224AE5A4|nr:hypothetical protein [Haladaptatus caseinilyticus]
MSRQTTLSDVTQRTLSESANAVTDDAPTTERGLFDRAQAHAADVAAAHFPNLPVEAIEWEVFHRRQRSTGAEIRPCERRDNDLGRLGHFLATGLGAVQFDRYTTN